MNTQTIQVECLSEIIITFVVDVETQHSMQIRCAVQY